MAGLDDLELAEPEGLRRRDCVVRDRTNVESRATSSRSCWSSFDEFGTGSFHGRLGAESLTFANVGAATSKILSAISASFPKSVEESAEARTIRTLEGKR